MFEEFENLLKKLREDSETNRNRIFKIDIWTDWASLILGTYCAAFIFLFIGVGTSLYYSHKAYEESKKINEYIERKGR